MKGDIEALRALIGAATPGPWRAEATSSDRTAGECAIIVRDDAGCGGTNAVDDGDGRFLAADAALIVAAVNALPSLLALLDETRRERDAMRERADANEKEIARLVRSKGHEAEIAYKLQAHIATTQTARAEAAEAALAALREAANAYVGVFTEDAINPDGSGFTPAAVARITEQFHVLCAALAGGGKAARPIDRTLNAERGR